MNFTESFLMDSMTAHTTKIIRTIPMEYSANLNTPSKP